MLWVCFDDIRTHSKGLCRSCYQGDFTNYPNFGKHSRVLLCYGFDYRLGFNYTKYEISQLGDEPYDVDEEELISNCMTL
ncbi:hypothetical protein Csa_011886 [Cucumis sativus]|uniref:Uncharacterized protein n=1 Tax=Cucumis sativus TaxID=3659 RepID=A0A0A0K3I1_CUCSA|nr:hypothetical protein Csa_011886 [Cucumis sativus]